MFTKTAFVVSAILASSVAGAVSDWIPISANFDHSKRFDIKAHSLNVSKNDKNVWVATAIIRTTTGTSMEFEIIAFPLSYCADGIGEMVVADTYGNLKHRNSIAANGGTVGSEIADKACGALKSWQQEHKTNNNDTTL
jgi:hypothetical protein